MKTETREAPASEEITTTETTTEETAEAPARFHNEKAKELAQRMELSVTIAQRIRRQLREGEVPDDLTAALDELVHIATTARSSCASPPTASPIARRQGTWEPDDPVDQKEDTPAAPEQVASSKTSSFEMVDPAETSQSEPPPAKEPTPPPAEPGPADGFVIVVKAKGTPSFRVRCRGDRPLLELKQTIAHARGLTVGAVKLLLKGKALKDDNKKTSAYKIAEGSKLLLTIKKGVSLKPYEPPPVKLTRAATEPVKSPRAKKSPEPPDELDGLDDILSDVLSKPVVLHKPPPKPSLRRATTEPVPRASNLLPRRNRNSPAAGGGGGLMSMMPGLMKMMSGNANTQQQPQEVDQDAWSRGLTAREQREIKATVQKDRSRMRSLNVGLSPAYIAGSPGLMQQRASR